ncbi:SDR family oxidoreductase [Chitinophaga sp.]|uniref:SDR family oxidoreductase n=1 Tax=Chitinophaga sp. TaxID=1869181 RepID=UPI0031D13DB1
MQKTIFITGASTGLGKATAKLFHARGWKVIATMRQPEKETELSLLDNVWLLPLDVTDKDQIAAAVAQAIDLGGVDVVFNNAGYGLMAPLEATSDEQISRQLNTNLLGVIYVTKAFIPHFRERNSGVFISTTSIGGIWGFPLHSLYHAAKFALEGWSEGMSYELSLFNIAIKTVAPGAIRTEFLGRSLERNSLSAYKALEDEMFSKIDTMMDVASPAELIAEVVYEAATDGKDQIRYIAGEDAKEMAAAHEQLGREAFRQELKKQFLLQS